MLVTHRAPEQTIELCGRLSKIFGDPPIAIHHDYSQSDLEKSKLPGNVSVVENWNKTGWGRPTVISAKRKALELLYQVASPEWYVCLSNQDYPIASPERILSDLREGGADAYIGLREMKLNLEGEQEPEGASVGRPPGSLAWVPMAYDRYVSVRITSHKVSTLLGWPKQPKFLRNRTLANLASPLKSGTRIYGGEAWYSANGKCAEAVLRGTEPGSSYLRHYQRRTLPEESMYQTILANTPGLRLEDRNFRYIDWTEGGAHPKLLGFSDLPRMMSSGDHFARKFENNPELFDEIDRLAAQSRMITASNGTGV